MNGSRSPRRKFLVGGSVVAALACVGAILTTAGPTSAKPLGSGGGGGSCAPQVTYTITMPVGATMWMPTSLKGTKVHGPSWAKLPVRSNYQVMASMPQALRKDQDAIFAQANARFTLDVVIAKAGFSNVGDSSPVPRGQFKGLQMYSMGRQFTVRKYAVNKAHPCMRGSLVYTGVVTAPVKLNAYRYFKFVLKS